MDPEAQARERTSAPLTQTGHVTVHMGQPIGQTFTFESTVTMRSRKRTRSESASSDSTYAHWTDGKSDEEIASAAKRHLRTLNIVLLAVAFLATLGAWWALVTFPLSTEVKNRPLPVVFPKMEYVTIPLPIPGPPVDESLQPTSVLVDDNGCPMHAVQHPFTGLVTPYTTWDDAFYPVRFMIFNSGERLVYYLHTIGVSSFVVDFTYLCLPLVTFGIPYRMIRFYFKVIHPAMDSRIKQWIWRVFGV